MKTLKQYVPCERRSLQRLMEAEMRGEEVPDEVFNRSVTRKPPPKAYRRVAVCPELVPPANGAEYTKLETVSQLRRTLASSRERKLMMAKMIELGYVPVKERALQRIMKDDANGVPVEDGTWSGAGKPPLLTDDDIQEFVRELMTAGGGEQFDRDSIRNFILTKKRSQLETRGEELTEKNMKVNEKTLRNYMAIIGSHPSMRVVATSAPKNRAQGNSLKITSAEFPLKRMR